MRGGPSRGSGSRLAFCSRPRAEPRLLETRITGPRGSGYFYGFLTVGWRWLLVERAVCLSGWARYSLSRGSLFYTCVVSGFPSVAGAVSVLVGLDGRLGPLNPAHSCAVFPMRSEGVGAESSKGRSALAGFLRSSRECGKQGMAGG
ncbi:hypothetical protein F5Y12DRAFT_715884 [Xylaria sp. FL1777]|nr:hypothetical protein F5Y12DRAFT_715884 [Xylaria sp. FL1777]